MLRVRRVELIKPSLFMTYNITTMDDLRLALRHILTNIPPSAIFTLTGHPGAGKTTLVKAAADILRVNERVQSPTFNLVNQYTGYYLDDSQINIYHLDCYRLTAMDNLLDLRFSELSGDTPFFAFIEWPEKVDINLLTAGLAVYSFKIETIWDEKLQKVTQRMLKSII